MFGLSKETILIIISITIVVVTTFIVVYTIYTMAKKPYVQKMILCKSDRLDRFRFENNGFVYKNMVGEENYVDVPVVPYDFKEQPKNKVGCAIANATLFSDHYITGVAGLKIYVDVSYYSDVYMYINEINGKKYDRPEVSLKFPSGLNMQIYITKLDPHKKYYIKVEGPAFFLGLIEPFGNFLSLDELASDELNH